MVGVVSDGESDVDVSACGVSDFVYDVDCLVLADESVPVLVLVLEVRYDDVSGRLCVVESSICLLAPTVIIRVVAAVVVLISVAAMSVVVASVSAVFPLLCLSRLRRLVSDGVTDSCTSHGSDDSSEHGVSGS